MQRNLVMKNLVMYNTIDFACYPVIVESLCLSAKLKSKNCKHNKTDK